MMYLIHIALWPGRYLSLLTGSILFLVACLRYRAHFVGTRSECRSDGVYTFLPVVQPVVQLVGWTKHMSPAKRRLRGPARTFVTSLRHRKADVWTTAALTTHTTVLFCSLAVLDPMGWPHHGRTFSIYLCPLSF